MDITFNQDFMLDFVNVLAAFFVGMSPLLALVLAFVLFTAGSYIVIGWLRRL